jgi:hypothetical protein
VARVVEKITLSFFLSFLWQERELRRREGWSQAMDRTFYMPTESDKAVRAMWQWLLSVGGGGPFAKVDFSFRVVGMSVGRA